MLLGRMILQNWNKEVDNKVEAVLSKVIMIDVPMIDNEVNYYLGDNSYEKPYITAIDAGEGDYGIYEIKDNKVVAYAHGKCVRIGEDVKPGVYKIVGTKSHLDYHDERYWRVIRLEEIHTGHEIVVSTPGYEIAEAPVNLTQDPDNSIGLDNGVEIGSEIMLTVFDNGAVGTILVVIDGELLNGKNHTN